MTHDERARLKKYVDENGVTPETNKWNYCCLLDVDEGLCMAYEARPFVCRTWENPRNGHALFGTSVGQPCGPRVDMLSEIIFHASKSQQTDTWELFGLEGKCN